MLYLLHMQPNTLAPDWTGSDSAGFYFFPTLGGNPKKRLSIQVRPLATNVSGLQLLMYEALHTSLHTSVREERPQKDVAVGRIRDLALGFRLYDAGFAIT